MCVQLSTLYVDPFLNIKRISSNLKCNTEKKKTVFTVTYKILNKESILKVFNALSKLELVTPF